MEATRKISIRTNRANRRNKANMPHSTNRTNKTNRADRTRKTCILNDGNWNEWDNYHKLNT